MSKTLEEELLEAQHRVPVVQSATEKLRTIFKIIDINKDGHIELHELDAGLKALGVPFSSDRTKQMFSLADKNGDGMISFEEFAQFFKTLPTMVETSNILPSDLGQRRIAERSVPAPPLKSTLRRSSLFNVNSSAPSSPNVQHSSSAHTFPSHVQDMMLE